MGLPAGSPPPPSHSRTETYPHNCGVLVTLHESTVANLTRRIEPAAHCSAVRKDKTPGLLRWQERRLLHHQVLNRRAIEVVPAPEALVRSDGARKEAYGNLCRDASISTWDIGKIQVAVTLSRDRREKLMRSRAHALLDLVSDRSCRWARDFET